MTPPSEHCDLIAMQGFMGLDQIIIFCLFSCSTEEMEKDVNESSYIVDLAALKHGIGGN